MTANQLTAAELAAIEANLNSGIHSPDGQDWAEYSGEVVGHCRELLKHVVALDEQIERMRLAEIDLRIREAKSVSTNPPPCGEGEA